MNFFLETSHLWDMAIESLGFEDLCFFWCLTITGPDMASCVVGTLDK